MIQSIIGFGDFRTYLLFLDRVNKVTADDVIAAFNKYVVNGNFVWSIAGDPSLVEKVNPDMYKGFNF